MSETMVIISETIVIIIEVLIALYLFIGLYVTSTLKISSENAADSQTLLFDFFLVLFWLPYLLVKLKNKRLTVVLAIIFVLPLLYIIL